MSEIIPAILAKSETEFKEKLALVEGHVEIVQIDIHDGELFPHTTWNDPMAVSRIETRIKYELHLMVKNPLAVAEEWSEHVSNIVRVIFHAELDRQHGPILEALKEMGYEVGLAINPETPVQEIHTELDRFDELLIMTVHPGLSGQGVGDKKHGIDENDLLNKVRDIHDRYPDLVIAVDGGMDENNALKFKNAGVKRFGVGSGIFNEDKPEEEVERLKTLVL